VSALTHDRLTTYARNVADASLEAMHDLMAEVRESGNVADSGTAGLVEALAVLNRAAVRCLELLEARR